MTTDLDEAIRKVIIESHEQFGDFQTDQAIRSATSRAGRRATKDGP